MTKPYIKKEIHYFVENHKKQEIQELKSNLYNHFDTVGEYSDPFYTVLVCRKENKKLKQENKKRFSDACKKYAKSLINK